MNRQCKCTDCGYVFDFEDRTAVKESHGFNDGFYETFSCCPNCGGELNVQEHTSALQCPYCEHYIILNERVEGEYAPISFLSKRLISSPVKFVAETSPVEISATATPRFEPVKQIAIRKLFLSSESTEESVTVPGVIMRAMSRLTNPFAVAGSSICSQTTTLYPFAINLDIYISAA